MSCAGWGFVASDGILADPTQQLLGEFPAFRLDDLERLFGRLDRRPSDTAYAERRCGLASWRILAAVPGSERR
jgi:hypothetical protein